MTKKQEEKERKFIETYVDRVEDLPDDETEHFREAVEYGCAHDWPVALHAKGFGSYGDGNKVFPCNWETARDCFLRLIELTGDAPYYNALGYIYYYGRCNGGVPEYEKAFQYFSVGAAHGLFESMYKLADMFLKGKGCLKSPTAAANIIASMYHENRDYFAGGGFDGKFADVALRLGGLFETGSGVDRSFENAYRYYLEAEQAIKERRAHFDDYGDGRVEANIRDALARVKKELPADYFTKSFKADAPIMFGALLSRSVGLDVTVEEAGRSYKITAVSAATQDAPGYELITIPEMDFCERRNEVTLSLDSSAEFLKEVDLPAKAFITEIRQGNEENVWEFRYRDMVMLAIRCGEFTFNG